MLKKDNGENKITEDKPIEDILKAMEKLYLDKQPLWVQRIRIFSSKQGANQKFEDWWIID